VHAGFWRGDLMEGHHLGDPGIDGESSGSGIGGHELD
jgi:hypothetical protein